MRKPNCQCYICKKDIYRRPSQIQSSRVYCSKQCVGVDQRNTKICSVCTKQFTGVKKTCSRSCANKGRYGIQYNGTNQNNKYVKGKVLKEKLALINNGICSKCKNDNYNILQVHHKIERCNGGTDELNNLILLCPNCHMTEHHGYGKWRVAEVSIPIPFGTASFQD
jgi:5-methylcytosine-specific restriction endonuclease McrA